MPEINDIFLYKFDTQLFLGKMITSSQYRDIKEYQEYSTAWSESVFALDFAKPLFKYIGVVIDDENARELYPEEFI